MKILETKFVLEKLPRTPSLQNVQKTFGHAHSIAYKHLFLIKKYSNSVKNSLFNNKSEC